MKIGRFYPALLLASMFAEQSKADDTFKLTNPYIVEPFRGMYINSNSPMFFPKRTKFKGWMREKNVVRLIRIGNGK